MKIWPGQPYPLGATFDGMGTNFAIFSEVAEQVELCLFEEDGTEQRLQLPEVTSHVWHGYIPNLQPGQRYAFRVYGPWDPDNGHSCNPNKLLLDPYAKAIEGDIQWNEALFGHTFADPEGSRNDQDSGPYLPKGIVVNPFFDWGADRPPRTMWHNTVIYETHVKGITARHPDIPGEIRGTYAALAHPVMIDYLRNLGVTAIELMPVHHFVHDQHLLDRGLRNYWGYNTIGYFAPYHAYASSGRLGEQVQEFKLMVKTLHDAGLEVILDVVYNHTAEGNHLGPMLSFKGIDNAAYYRLVSGKARYYMDYTGTGNSLNVRHPQVLQLILDSLRYWIQEMHVDGFRFDLAATLARELHEVDRLSAFFDLIHQDPVVSQVKLIAEPWDVGEGGYQVGNFPPQWSEWNGKYRDCVRDYWRGIDRTMNEFAYRITGSSDLYETQGRTPFASINFITAHDGFPLQDLVSYNDKHNEANGEENRDGESHNRSWNCGHEGPTEDPAVLALREQQRRNFLATLLLSQGIPMLLGGDEIGRTQRGNNNAYCQDNEISWYDWSAADLPLFEFVASLIRFRRQHAAFRRRRYFQGRPIYGAQDIHWIRPDGNEMTDDDWKVGYAKSFAVFLNGGRLDMMDARGEPVIDDDFYLIFNAHHEPLTFTISSALGEGEWIRVVDTSGPRPLRRTEEQPMSAEERARLRELLQYQILDTPPEQAFDDLAKLAAQICGTPIALISLLDADRQWFKARIGLEAQQTPRNVAFCHHAIQQHDVMVVPDASVDSRFAQNPLVLQDPQIRFYAGAPIVTGAGHALGTVCVIDRVPRTLSAEQKAALEAISRQVVAQLEMRRRMSRLAGDVVRVMETENPGAIPPEATTERWKPGDSISAASRSLVLLMRLRP